MRKGIGPQGLGAAKSPAKMYGAKSPAKQTSWDSQKEDNDYKRSRKKDNERISRNYAREELDKMTKGKPGTGMSNETMRNITNSLEQKKMSELRTKQLKNASKR